MPASSTKALAGLRIAVGVLFLIFGEYKVVGTQFTLGGGFQSWIGRFLQDGAYPFMVPVLKNFVLPHATPIAFLVAYGELAIGLRRDLHAQLIAFGQLPRPTCRFLAVLRRFFGTPSVSALFCRICLHKTGRTFVHTHVPAVSSVSVNVCPHGHSYSGV